MIITDSDLMLILLKTLIQVNVLPGRARSEVYMYMNRV